MARVIIDNVSVVFGKNKQQAMALADEGANRSEVEGATKAILGVHDCNLTIEQGEILVLMGLSGSGKSTLLRTINGLITPARGQVIVEDDDNNYDVAKLKKRELQFLRTKLVSMVFQQFGLLPWRSVADNVGLGLEIAKIPRQTRADLVREQLALVGLEEWADHPISALSGGMQQRVGLARAFSTGAPILLMDEPFSALDPLIRNHLQDQLKEIQRRLNKAIIFVSHDLNEAMRIGTRIAIMRDARIVQYGTPQEIVLSPIDSHVAEFVQHINPLTFLTARDIMLPFNRETARVRVSAMAKATTPLCELINALVKSPGEIGIVEKGQIIGSVSNKEILSHLARQ
ncbi:ATP-binding cassette domain-containing protein [Bartonella sp. HY329]|uniref:quaternary amine ABC transporter ATP-binding protein n=1 Tax=unclassified Bartonella TaxID=2645622 RepID=UPI0021C988E2|nr:MULTISPECIES: ATP-binding cassette domain-containing protein [unclassified Bartonella]UXM94509.1 ATP-binding cassette domain-containing protein [Bartonella sp. HY329]UXN08833.1 ATP-binding cassette domain-containing protein [Bartonella sp. HY328]